MVDSSTKMHFLEYPSTIVRRINDKAEKMGKGNASKTKMPKDRKKSLAPPKKEEEP